MRYPTRATVCVSSQAGCAMGVHVLRDRPGRVRAPPRRRRDRRAGRCAPAHATPQRVSNVVFMGMGEPLANYDATWGAVERLHDDVGISARRITVSTVGVVPGIRRLAAERCRSRWRCRCTRADDELRNELVPLNRRYPIAEVLDAAAEFAGAHGPAGHVRVRVHRRRQRPARPGRGARAPARAFPGPGGAHVNLIPLNPTAGFAGPRRPPRPRSGCFASGCDGRGVTATIRRNRGTDIDAACGQLRARGRDPRGPRHRQEWRREQVEVGQSVPAPDPRHRHVPLLHRRRLRAAVRRRSHVGARADSRSSRCSAPAASASPTRSGGATPSRSSARSCRCSCSSPSSAASLLTSTAVISLLFDGALVALLLHPMSREYQRIWFK